MGRLASEKTLLEIMNETSLPALRLTTAATAGFSKTGGLPNLPAGMAWPFWRNIPLSFVAQLDLAELKVAKTLPEFPAEGRLYFFYPQWLSDEPDDLLHPWGYNPEDAGSAVVIYSLAEPGPPVEPPEEMSRPGLFLLEEMTGVYCERFVSAVPVVSWPDDATWKWWPTKAAPTEEEREEASEAYFNWRISLARELRASQPVQPYRGLTECQLGGHPVIEQYDDMRLERQLTINGIASWSEPDLGNPEIKALAPGAEDWRLLLQLESDGEGDYLSGTGRDPAIWPGYGYIYFWIRKQDLANRDFSRVWVIEQCT